VLVIDDTIVYSASDLAAASRCEYALLRQFDSRLGWGPGAEVEDDLLARTAALGADHERRRLDRLRADFGVVRTIGRPSYTIAGFTAAAAATRQAIADGVPVVYQAAMFNGRFVGFADFLIRAGAGYEVTDTKLARSAKVTALLQLAAYADTLAAAGVPIAPQVQLILGDGAVARYQVDELVPVYRSQRARLQQLLDDHRAGGSPVRWDNEQARACFRCAQCAEQLHATDDVLLVAGMRISQRVKLLGAGVGTVAELAERTAPVPDLAPRALDKLIGLAKLRVLERDTGVPSYQVTDPQPLALLPNPSNGDLFFDFEGDPLWTDNGTRWGLEYLFGVLAAGSAGFRPLWAHSRAEEREVFVQFLALVAKRRKRHPDMHIYHYAPYEKTALLRLAGQYGVGEHEVDDLLRSGTLVDLYPVVRKAVQVGAESFSLKALEPLFMGAELRKGEVTTAADSITQYARFCELRADGRVEEAATVLKEIEDYNHYDCRSTRALRDWLLLRAFEHGITPLGAQPVADGGDVEQHDAVAVRLAQYAGDAAGDRTAQQQAVALVAAARGYHRREDKPFWWAHFDRLNFAVDEWADNTDVFIVDDASLAVDWCQPPRTRKPQRRVRLTGALARGELKRAVFALYEPPAPVAVTANPDRRAAGRASVIWADDWTAPTEVEILERAPGCDHTFRQLPLALTPGSPIPTTKQRESIEKTAADVAVALPELPRTAVIDVLLRRAPRLRGGATLPRGADTAANITAALLNLDASYLAVHGPPGTGKTYTAAHVITGLIARHQWRIGVVAQSHAVVENLLRCAITSGVDPLRVAKKSSDDSSRPWQVIDEAAYSDFISGTPGCVIGGTAWDFSNSTRVPPGSLDLLVIDEAGQFCLANTIAVAPAAKNLLLLGDPQQLPQVSQGTHPEPVDTSALGWLVDGQRTLPVDLGYFLDRSYRMRPEVCAAVSQLSYDGRLLSDTDRTTGRCLAGFRAGVQVLPVAHEGNSTASPEEADAIVNEIQRLRGSPWSDEHGTRPLEAADVLVLAPYNAQVGLLRQQLTAAGLDPVRVGTVDKFQGAQAPVVFISMTASSVDEVPRGMSFLFNRNRLNVAVSRAQYAAVIVRSPLLTEYLPATPATLVELGAFLALTSPGERQSVNA
jgi:uncharacterized protein